MVTTHFVATVVAQMDLYLGTDKQHSVRAHEQQCLRVKTGEYSTQQRASKQTIIHRVAWVAIEDGWIGGNCQ